MRVNVFRCIFIMATLLWSVSLSAQQTQIIYQDMYWVRYYNQIFFNKTWSLQTEVEDRRFLSNSLNSQFVVHSRAHYKFNPKIELAAGLTYNLQGAQSPDAVSSNIVQELRPVQEIYYNDLLTSRFVVQQRLRLDERFVLDANRINFLKYHDFFFRMRYRLQLSYKISKVSALPSTIKLSDEVMFQFNKGIVYNHFDQNRLYLGFEQGLAKNYSAELGFIYLHQQKISGYQYLERDIIRFTLYHRIPIK